MHLQICIIPYQSLKVKFVKKQRELILLKLQRSYLPSDLDDFSIRCKTQHFEQHFFIRLTDGRFQLLSYSHKTVDTTTVNTAYNWSSIVICIGKSSSKH